MATREDNLNKINSELEKLSDEELENIAGGTSQEAMDLAKLLPKVGKSHYGEIRQESMNPAQIADWLKDNLGIDAQFNLGNRFFNRPGDPSIYTKNSENLTHQQVMAEVKNFFGK